MTTEEIIADLRQNGLTSASIYTRMERAANRLEELQQENVNALFEQERLKDELTNRPEPPYRPNYVRKDPPRLEIAAMLKAGWFANPDALTSRDEDPKWWIEQADILIAAAKERA